eukprot:1307105-Rhodomonas_salina.8
MSKTSSGSDDEGLLNERACTVRYFLCEKPPSRGTLLAAVKKAETGTGCSQNKVVLWAQAVAGSEREGTVRQMRAASPPEVEPVRFHACTNLTPDRRSQLMMSPRNVCVRACWVGGHEGNWQNEQYFKRKRNSQKVACSTCSSSSAARQDKQKMPSSVSSPAGPLTVYTPSSALVPSAGSSGRNNFSSTSFSQLNGTRGPGAIEGRIALTITAARGLPASTSNSAQLGSGLSPLKTQHSFADEESSWLCEVAFLGSGEP